MTAYAALIIIATIAGLYKVFEKAGIPGWKSIVPIYSNLLILRMIGRPDWWLLLMLVPLVNIVVAIVVQIEMAERFGKGILFGAGLFFFPFVLYPLLGFGNVEYHPPN